MTQDAMKHSFIGTVHPTMEQVASIELTPPHAARTETPEYKKSHDYLVNQQDKPCLVCGVSKSTLKDPAKNVFGAKAMETHHYPIEWSLQDACDPDKVHKFYPEVIDRETLAKFVDSPRNLVVLCDVHHRSTATGIHHLLVQDWVILPFLFDGYSIAATVKTEATELIRDAMVEQAHNEQ